MGGRYTMNGLSELFCVNCYQRHAFLVNRGALGKSVIISSQELYIKVDGSSELLFRIVSYGIAHHDLVAHGKNIEPSRA